MAQIDLGFEFRRSNKKPVDVSSVWDSLEDAQNYAAGLDGTKGASYVGQIIAVLKDGKYHGYVIEEDYSLSPLGDGGGGGITIDDIVSDDGSINITEGQDNVLHMTVSKILNPEIEIPIS